MLVDMMRKFLLSLVLTFMSMLPCWAGVFEDANAKFKSGDFAAAASAYENVISQEGPSLAALYNLGNSYHQAKKYGLAILAYERALLIRPHDADVHANLKIARRAAKVIDERDSYTWWDHFTHALSRHQWSWLVLGAALFAGLVFLLNGIMTWQRKTRFGLFGAAVFSLGLTAIGGSALYVRRTESKQGIVISPEAEVRLSPFEKAESQGKIAQGNRVILGERNGDFYYINVANSSLSGWISASEVAAISQENPKR